MAAKVGWSPRDDSVKGDDKPSANCADDIRAGDRGVSKERGGRVLDGDDETQLPQCSESGGVGNAVSCGAASMLSSD